MSVRLISDVNIIETVDEEGMTIGSHGEAMLSNILGAVDSLGLNLVRDAPRSIRMRDPHETPAIGPCGHRLVVRRECQPTHSKLISPDCLGNDVARGIGHRVVLR